MMHLEDELFEEDHLKGTCQLKHPLENILIARSSRVVTRNQPSHACLFAALAWEDWDPACMGRCTPHALTVKVVAGCMHRNMVGHDVKLSFYQFGIDTTDL